MATDLYVHVCTSINYVMDAPMPESVIAMGGLYRWKTSRDVPDIINASLRYPEGFMVSLSGTFGNQRGGAGSMRIMGTEGTLVMGSSLRFIPEIVYESNQWVVESWPEDLAKAYYDDEQNRFTEMPSMRVPRSFPGEEEYRAEGEGSLKVHIAEWLEAIKHGTPTVEDAMVGHHAASCAYIRINLSLEHESAVRWDADLNTLHAG